MQILFNYNFNPEDIVDLDFEALYEKRRRDSCFAFVFEKNEKIYALRDHFGIVPLYFSWRENELVFSTTLDPLLTSKSRLDLQGYKTYIALGTAKVLPLLEHIRIAPPGSVIEIDKRNKEIKPIYEYRFKKLRLDRSVKMSDLVQLLDHLLLQATKRTVKYDEVGLYLSGGIDSAITGVYLTKCGVKVNAYTCSRWGKQGSEMQYSTMNSERIGVRYHYIDALDSKKVKESLDKIVDVYKVPNADPASIGITSLQLHTPISKEKQIYGGQGADTINCAMSLLNIGYMSSFMPGFLRTKISPQMSNDIIDSCIRIRSRGLLNSKDMPQTIMNSIQAISGKIERLSIAGMLIYHTPQDSETLSAPTINSNILYSNPFYDVDVAEFFLGIHLRYRIRFSREYLAKRFLDKIVLRKLAGKHLDAEVIKIKKTFNIPLHLYGVDKELEKFEARANIPSDIRSKFAAYILSKYCASRNINYGHHWHKEI